MHRRTMVAACWIGLVGSLVATAAGCRRARRVEVTPTGGAAPVTQAAPEARAEAGGAPADPHWQSRYGQSGRPLLLEGQRWARREEASHPLLVDGATLLEMAPWDERWKHPPNETLFVRGLDGRIRAIHRLTDLQPHLARVTTGDQALAYAWFLRRFFGGMPGLPLSTPERFGVNQRLLERDLRAEGLDPTPDIDVGADGIEIQRHVIVLDVEDGRVTYRLVRLRERVARDGGFETEILETLRTGSEVERWVFRPM